MKTEEFESIVQSQISRCQNILCSKAREYATDDRLHNFKVAGAVQGCTPRQALAGMMAKHTVSVYDMCRAGEYPPEMWDEKITDSINYLLLLCAVVQDADIERDV